MVWLLRSRSYSYTVIVSGTTCTRGCMRGPENEMLCRERSLHSDVIMRPICTWTWKSTMFQVGEVSSRLRSRSCHSPRLPPRKFATHLSKMLVPASIASDRLRCSCNVHTKMTRFLSRERNCLRNVKLKGELMNVKLPRPSVRRPQ